LVVKCHERMRDSAIFLFTSGGNRPGKVVAQFPISIAILRGGCMEKSQVEGIERLFGYGQDVLCIYLKSF